MAKNTKATSLTGRDGYIMGQALVYAIAQIQALPDEKQEFSNMCDMCIIARNNYALFMPPHIYGVFAHTGIKVNLWPEDEPVGKGVMLRDEIESFFASTAELVAERQRQFDALNEFAANEQRAA